MDFLHDVDDEKGGSPKKKKKSIGHYVALFDRGVDVLPVSAHAGQGGAGASQQRSRFGKYKILRATQFAEFPTHPLYLDDSRDGGAGKKIADQKGEEDKVEAGSRARSPPIPLHIHL